MEEKDSILTDIVSHEIEANRFQKFLATAVDIVASILLVLIMYKILPREILFKIMESSTVSRYIFVIVLMEAYRLILIFAFGRTLGMMVCKVKYLNAHLLPLTNKEKLIASVATRTNAIRYYKV